jgi:hypothetical protein
MPNYLKSALGDPERRRSEGLIRKPLDVIVYVEGDFDCSLFESIWREKPSIKVQPVFSLGRKGKNGVIDIVSQTTNSFGIVDMDHDFSGFKIDKNPRIVDTRDKCCLHAYFFDHTRGEEFIDKLAREVFPKNKSKRKILSLEILKYWPKIINLGKERTIARLFRGKNKSKLKRYPNLKDVSKWMNINELNSINDSYVSDLIPNELSNDYSQFKIKYSKYLNNIGINDHELEYLICGFIEVYGPKKIRSYKIIEFFKKGSIRFITSIKHGKKANRFLTSVMVSEHS